MDNLTVPPLRRLSHVSALLGLLIAAVLITSDVGAQMQENPALINAQRSTVFLMQTYEVAGSQALSCVGSGTLISPTGLILTNAHLADDLGPCRGERVIVSLPVRLDEPPVPTYLADIVQIDSQLDIAVMQITGGLDGSLVEPASLNLPYVSPGDPSGLLPGNTLSVVGYTGIGSESVTVSQTTITNLHAETAGSRFAWLRINTPLGGGMSGGGAYDANGRLVALATSAPGTTGDEPGPTCLSIQDNNHDGQINARDACIPIGGAVTLLRPSNFAMPLIEASLNGFILSHSEGFRLGDPIGSPSIGRLVFSQQINDVGLPTQIVTELPSGTDSLFLFFDYDNMLPGTPYEVRVTNNGLEMPQFSLGPLAWGGNTHGLWYVGTENVLWPDGNYEFTIFLNGNAVASAGITVEGSSAPPTFSGLSFGIPDGLGGYLSTGTLLPAGITQVDARFDFENMADGQDWTEVWYLDKVEVFRMTYLWDKGPSGQATVSAVNYEGLPLGVYRLELFIGDRLAATGDLTLAGNPSAEGNALIFSDARTSSEISREGAPAGTVGTAMPYGITSLYTFVAWDNMPNGTAWTYRWFQDGRLVASSTQPWNAGGVGDSFWLGLSSDSPLPEGSYAVEVLVQNRPLFSTDVSVGGGTGAVAGEQGEGEGVEIRGTVRDAITAEGVPGALIIVLDVELESAEFVYDESQIYTSAISDREGRFALTRSLQRGRFYTVYVFAQGYITIVEDNFAIPREQPSPTEIVIELSPP